MKTASRSNVYGRLVLCLYGILLAGCQPHSRQLPNYRSPEVANLWAQMTLHVTRNTPNTPTYASRALGYIGLTMYESVVHADSTKHSLAGQLNGLAKLPQPERGQLYNYCLALNAGQALILRSLYKHTSDANKVAIDSLERMIQEQYALAEDETVVERSVAYGRAIAERIFVWSKADGGHRGYLHNFPVDVTIPQKPGSWKPPMLGQSFSRWPLHPFWGSNRTFLRTNAEMPLPVPMAYSTDPQSPYYQQFRAVYEQNRNLTQEQKEIALWWGDDPADSFSPPGHSYNLARLAVKKSRPSLSKAAETYARVGMAVAEAFICCWRCKYRYFSERPSTFVTEHIDADWMPFWPDPPFPAFPSGHATQAAAAATVLTDLYGENFSLVDDSHVGRSRDEYRNVEFKTRRFNSFWATAEESARSRFYGGIHTQQDNEIGLAQGKMIGIHINQLRWSN